MTAKRIALLASLLAFSCGIYNQPARADSFFISDVVNLYYGTLTLLSPGGTLVSTTNIVTAGTDMGAAYPAAFVSGQFPTLVSQLQNDPQTAIANIPAWVMSGLAGLENANGFGLDDSSHPSPDLAVTAFDAQIAAIAGGPFTTKVDTGFAAPPPSLAEGAYDCSLSPAFCPPTISGYEFTYQLGPETIGNNDYTALVNFQIFGRDVTEQQIATPLPGSLALFSGGLIAFGFFLRRAPRRSPRAV